MTKELEQDILYQAKVILDKINKSPDEYKNNPMTQNLMKWYEALIDAVTTEPQESDESLNKRMPTLQEELLGPNGGLETSHSDEDDDYEDYTTPEEDAAMKKRLEEEEAARLEEAEEERKHKKLVNTVAQNYNDHPEYMDHFGEEQAEGLDNLLEGLRDTPHDNRW